MSTRFTLSGVGERRALASDVQILRREPSAVGAQKIKRVAAYCRVSTDMEQQAGSLDTQTAVFHRMIAAHAGWEAAGIYADDGVTGTSTKNRAHFQRMIADCEAGKIDFILTKSISRFARNTQDCINTIRKLKELGVYIYFDDIHLDTGSPSSEMIITILAAVAQEESRGISENMKLGMRMRFKAGKPKWVNTYGYQKGGDGQYHIKEAQAAGVRRIFELYVSGRSLPQIAKQLEKEGIPSANGGPWWPKSLAAVLHNEKYVGDVMMQKTYTIDHLTHKKVKNDRTVVPSYYVKDHHEAVVDRKTFERAQTILKLKDRHGGCVQYPYHGRLVCPLCGGGMIAFRLPGGDRTTVWTCGGQHCPPYVVHAKTIDDAVREAYRRLDVDALAALSSEAAQAALRRKQAQPCLQAVEYLFLDEMVESITFLPWSQCVIAWKFDLTSRVTLRYDKVSEIPNVALTHKEGVVLMDGERVHSSGQVLGRIEKVKASCQKARTLGALPRPRPGKEERP